MAFTQRSPSSGGVLCYPLLRGHGRRSSGSNIKCAKRRDLAENDNPKTQKPSIKFTLRAPYPLLARSAVAIFGLGFIDAGYSGDWSRIGVISKEGEDLLKVAAFLVVPLCIFAILSISREPDT